MVEEVSGGCEIAVVEAWTGDREGVVSRGELGRGKGGLKSPRSNQVVVMGCREPKEMLVEEGWVEEYGGRGGGEWRWRMESMIDWWSEAI